MAVTRVYSEQSASGVRAWCVASVAVAPPWICGARKTKALLPSKASIPAASIPRSPATLKGCWAFTSR
jgi:hypothetical protein